MAKRRSKEQIAADKIIKKELLKLGNIITDESAITSRIKTSKLRNSQGRRVFNDTTLRVFQVEYGAYNYPIGENSGEKNALLISVKKHVPESTKVIVSNLIEKIIDPFKK
jgi:hypothetical protein